MHDVCIRQRNISKKGLRNREEKNVTKSHMQGYSIQLSIYMFIYIYRYIDIIFF